MSAALTAEDVRAIANASGRQAAQEVLASSTTRDLIQGTVRETLLQLGLDPKQPLEAQKDLAALRSWRLASGEIQKRGVLTAIGIMVSGILALLIVGFRTWLQK